VVLFDEIEKAHEDVWSILLQIMEDAQLTDSAGRRVDFSNALVIMTSNVGARAISQPRPPLGFAGEESGESKSLRALVEGELKTVFRPEFLNRLDETVIFRRLGQEELLRITEKLTEAVRERFAALGIYLAISRQALHFLAEKGGSPEHGARDLRRTVQAELVDSAAELLLEGRISAGDRLSADVEEGRIVFNKK